jgi:hypothetical protein
LAHPQSRVVGIAAGVTVVVKPDAVAEAAAQKLPNGYVAGLTGYIPQGHLDATDGAHDSALIKARRRHAALHVAEEFVYVAWVLADYGAGEAWVDGDLVHTGTVVGFADANQSLVGAHFDLGPRGRAKARQRRYR